MSANIFRKNILEKIKIVKKSIKYNIYGPQNCQIHGNWSDYINWTPCKNGKEKGFRFCTDPEPKYEGNDCEGEHFIIQDCNITYDGKKVSIYY